MRAAFFAAVDRSAGPFVRAAFFAAIERSSGDRFSAALCAWRASAVCDAALWPSRLSALSVARDRLAEVFVRDRAP